MENQEKEKDSVRLCLRERILRGEVSFGTRGEFLPAGNLFHLISAGLILYASNIWMETGILAAFLVSLGEAGILQKKTLQLAGPVFCFFREKP
jgi:hypothetical protein